jgi:segregation and condensation protein B
MEELKNILESLIFVSKDPLSILQMKKILPEIDTKEIRQTLDDLVEEYKKNKRGFYLREIAGGYQFRSRPEYRQWISALIQPSPVRLSKAALETLSIIAYRQPIIRSDIEHVRGVDSGGILRMLMERKLIRALGRKDIPGRPLIYATTKQFLSLFDLKDLKDLPSLKEIEEFGKQSQAALDEVDDDLLPEEKLQGGVL